MNDTIQSLDQSTLDQPFTEQALDQLVFEVKKRAVLLDAKKDEEISSSNFALPNNNINSVNHNNNNNNNNNNSNNSNNSLSQSPKHESSLRSFSQMSQTATFSSPLYLPSSHPIPTQLSQTMNASAVAAVTKAASMSSFPLGTAPPSNVSKTADSVDEWTRLVLVQQAIQDKAAKDAQLRERAVRSQVQQDLKQQMQEHELRKAQQHEQKRQQLEHIRQQVEEWKLEEEKKKEAERRRQQESHTSLTDHMRTKQQHAAQELQKKRDEEQRMLALFGQKESEQIQREAHSKQQQKLYMEQLLKDNQRQETIKKEAKEREKAEDVRLIQAYSQMLENQDKSREESLRQMQHRQEAMESFAVSSNLTRMAQEKAEDERRAVMLRETEQQQREREQYIADCRKLIAKDTAYSLEQQMRAKLERNKIERDQSEAERKRISDHVVLQDQRDLQQKQQKRAAMDDYRAELQRQMEEDKHKKKHQHQMTEQERRIHGSHMRLFDQSLLPTHNLCSSPSHATSFSPYSQSTSLAFSPTHSNNNSNSSNILPGGLSRPRSLQVNLSVSEDRSNSRLSPFGSVAKSIIG